MIRRGTTPTHTLRMFDGKKEKFDTSSIKTIMVIYGQNDVELFHKNKEDCVLLENAVRVTLTQKETLKVDHKRNVQIQIRGLTHNDVAFATRIITVAPGKILNEEVLT